MRGPDPVREGTLERLPSERSLRTGAPAGESALSLIVSRTGEIVGGWMNRAMRVVRRLGRRLRGRLSGDEDH